MKRTKSILTISVATGILAGLTVWLGAQATSPRKLLADLMPSNALLYVEARNLNTLLQDWNVSPEKKTWLASGTYQSFQRSKLALRLEEVQKAYADGFGVNPNVALLENIAGGESAVAVYDIGKLELLFVTRLPAARLADNLLMQARTKFQTRNASGQTYYTKTASDGTIAFAVVASGDLLIAGTREDLVAGALQLHSATQQQQRPGMSNERWYTAATAKAAITATAPPDLRMVANMERTVRTPHFRSYWIQQNITDLRQYYAAVSDMHFSQGAWTERRTLLRAEPAAAIGEAGVAALARLAPADAGFYQASANPNPREVGRLIAELLVPEAAATASGIAPENERAPSESLHGGAGSEIDLDQRIDVEEPGEPSTGASSAINAAVRSIAGETQVSAMARFGGTRQSPGGVYIGVDSAVALLRSSGTWEATAVQAALRTAAEESWSATGSLRWNQRTPAIAELSGLQPLQVWIDGPVLIVANSASWMDRIVAARGNNAAARTGSYIAGYRHGGENARYAGMMRLLDAPQIPTGAARAPMLFSENIAGIGQVLSRVSAVSMETKDNGAEVRQVVVYRRTS